MIQYNDEGLLICDALFHYKDVSLSGRAILDTGASVTLIDRPFAEKLGLPLILEGFSSGVGGVVPSWTSKADGINIVDIPQCDIGTVDVMVTSVPSIRPAVALISIDTLRKMGLVADLRPEEAVLGCKKGGVLGPTVSVRYSKIKLPSRWRTWNPEEEQAALAIAIIGVLLGVVAYYSIVN